MIRTYRIAAVLLMLFLIASIGCRPAGDEEQPSDTQGENAATTLGNDVSREPQAVEAQLISLERFFGAIETSGVARGIQEAAIVSETSGVIESVHVRLGEKVSTGQVLVTLNDALERFAVEQARDQLSVSEIEFAAIQKLYEAGNSSDAALARAKAAVSGNRSALAQAQRRLGNRIITSPITGHVATIPQSVSKGNYIQPGLRIATIVNMEQVRISIGLGEREIQMVAVDNRANVYIGACGSAPQEASVRSLAAGNNNQSGVFNVDIEFLNKCGPKLKSGMSARVQIDNNAQEASVVIPARALVTENEEQFVFVAQAIDGMYFAKQRAVKIARILGDRAEIESGLQEQEILIVAPVQILEDGVEISPTVIRG